MLKLTKEIKVVENQDGKMVVSSREVAKNFEKRHDHVLNAIADGFYWIIDALKLNCKFKGESAMTTEITVTGKQEFMGVEIPIVLGGFGMGKKAISDKTIADIHGMETRHVRELFNRNVKRFLSGIDSIDLKGVVQNDSYFLTEKLGYSKQQITQSEHIYILSERGYAKLIKIMDSDLAWEIHDKLIDEYF